MENYKHLSILVISLFTILFLFSFVSASQTSINRVVNYKIGECYKGNTITDIKYTLKTTTIKYIKGCDKIEVSDLGNCILVGNGNQNNFNIIIKKYGDFPIDMNWLQNKYPIETYKLLKNTYPLNNVDVNIYYSKDNSNCNLKLKNKDIIFNVRGTFNCYGGEISNSPNIVYCNPFTPNTLLHEIGHTFGLAHNSDKTNYMNMPVNIKANYYTTKDSEKVANELKDLNKDSEVLY